MVTKACNDVFKERTPLPYINVRAMNRMNPPYDVYTVVMWLGRRLILIMMMMVVMMMLVMMLVMILMMLSPLIVLVVLAMIKLCCLILLITNMLPQSHYWINFVVFIFQIRISKSLRPTWMQFFVCATLITNYYWKVAWATAYDWAYWTISFNYICFYVPFKWLIWYLFGFLQKIGGGRINICRKRVLYWVSVFC